MWELQKKSRRKSGLSLDRTEPMGQHLSNVNHFGLSFVQLQAELHCRFKKSPICRGYLRALPQTLPNSLLSLQSTPLGGETGGRGEGGGRSVGGMEEGVRGDGGDG